MGIPVVDADGNITLKYKTAKWYYHNNSEYREKVIASNKANYLKKKNVNPEVVKEKDRSYMKNKYHEDHEYRERQKARALARYYAKKCANQQSS